MTYFLHLIPNAIFVQNTGARFRSQILVMKIVTRIVTKIVMKKLSKSTPKKFMNSEVGTCVKIKIASHYNSHYNFCHKSLTSETGPSILFYVIDSGGRLANRPNLNDICLSSLPVVRPGVRGKGEERSKILT